MPPRKRPSKKQEPKQEELCAPIDIEENLAPKKKETKKTAEEIDPLVLEKTIVNCTNGIVERLDNIFDGISELTEAIRENSNKEKSLDIEVLSEVLHGGIKEIANRLGGIHDALYLTPEPEEAKEVVEVPAEAVPPKEASETLLPTEMSQETSQAGILLPEIIGKPSGVASLSVASAPQSSIPASTAPQDESPKLPSNISFKGTFDALRRSRQ